MNKFLARGIALGSLVAVSACAGVYEPTPKIEKIEDAWLISNTAALSNTIVRTPQSTITTCTAPPPDAAFDQSEEADINISLVSVGSGSDSDAEGESEASQETELAGRTPAVLLSRELFYRTCEFSQNYRLDKAEALKLYNRTLDIVEKNWAVEAGQTTVTIGDSVTTSQGATISNTVSQTESQTGTTSATSSETTSDTSSESSTSSGSSSSE